MKQSKDVHLSKFPKAYNIEIMKDEVLKRNEIIDKILES